MSDFDAADEPDAIVERLSRDADDDGDLPDVDGWQGMDWDS